MWCLGLYLIKRSTVPTALLSTICTKTLALLKSHEKTKLLQCSDCTLDSMIDTVDWLQITVQTSN